MSGACLCCFLLDEFVGRNYKSDVKSNALVMAVYKGLAVMMRREGLPPRYVELCDAHAAILARRLKTIGNADSKKSPKRKP